MDEKYLKRDIFLFLGIVFVVFSVLFFVVNSFMALKLVESSKDREYMIIGECFKFSIGMNMKELVSIARHAGYDVESYVKDKELELVDSLAKNIFEVHGITGFYVFEKFGKVIYKSKEPLGQINALALDVMRSRSPKVKIIKEGKVINISAGVPLKSGGALVVERDLSDILESAKRVLGGEFELLNWTELPSEIVSRIDELGRDYIFERHLDRTDVYYRISTEYGKTDYFIHWAEASGRKAVVFRVLGLITAFFLPMFVMIIFAINTLKRKIFTTYIEPLQKMIVALDDIVAATSSSSQELAASSQELAANTKNLEEKGEKLSRLSSEMLDDLDKTTEFAESVSEFSEFLKKALADLADINSKLTGVMRSIRELGGFIQQIGERIVVLSINASIEGSRETIDREAIKALAEEIAQLSESTTKQVSEIFTAIQDSQDGLDEMERAVKSIMLETEKLESGSKKLFEMIKANRGEFEKITDTVQSMFTSIEEINLASQNLAEAATELSRKAYEVQRVIDEFFAKESDDKGGKGDV